MSCWRIHMTGFLLVAGLVAAASAGLNGNEMKYHWYQLCDVAELEGQLEGALCEWRDLARKIIKSKNAYPDPGARLSLFMRQAWNCLLENGKIRRTSDGYPALLSEERTRSVREILGSVGEFVRKGNYPEAVKRVDRAIACCREGFQAILAIPESRVSLDLLDMVRRGELDRMKEQMEAKYARVRNVLKVLSDSMPGMIPQFHLTIVDSPFFEAFMNPFSKHLIVGTRELELYDDSQLAWVLGHEIGHYLLVRSLRILPWGILDMKQYQARAVRLLGNAIKTLCLAPVRKYVLGVYPINFLRRCWNREKSEIYQAPELAADAIGVIFLARTPYRDGAAIEVLELDKAEPYLREYEAQFAIQAKVEESEPFREHPDPDTRIKYCREVMAAIKAAK